MEFHFTLFGLFRLTCSEIGFSSVVLVGDDDGGLLVSCDPLLFNCKCLCLSEVLPSEKEVGMSTFVKC